MCPCASVAVVVRTTVLHIHLAGSSAGGSGFGHSSYSPAIARTPSPCRKCGTLAPSRFSHSKYPSEGTIARRRQAAALNEGLVVMVSIRALINRDPILVSRAQDGTNPPAGRTYPAHRSVLGGRAFQHHPHRLGGGHVVGRWQLLPHHVDRPKHIQQLSVGLGARETSTHGFSLPPDLARVPRPRCRRLNGRSR